jgi:hypothetical protein
MMPVGIIAKQKRDVGSMEMDDDPAKSQQFKISGVPPAWESAGLSVRNFPPLRTRKFRQIAREFHQ